MARDHVTSSHKGDALRTLKQKQERLVVGHVLSQNDQGLQVTTNVVRKFSRISLGKNISATTARRILARNHISQHHGRQQKINKSADLAKIYRKWIKEYKQNGSLLIDKSRIGSLDFTYISHKTTRPKTYSRCGGKAFFIFIS